MSMGTHETMVRLIKNYLKEQGIESFISPLNEVLIISNFNHEIASYSPMIYITPHLITIHITPVVTIAMDPSDPNYFEKIIDTIKTDHRWINNRWLRKVC